MKTSPKIVMTGLRNKREPIARLRAENGHYFFVSTESPETIHDITIYAGDELQFKNENV